MKLLNVINKTLDGFLIPRYSLSIEERVRRRLFVFFTVIFVFPLTLFGFVHLTDGCFRDGIINFIMVTLLVLLIVMLKYLKQGKFIFRLAILFTLLLIFYFLHTGLADGYSTLWILLAPPSAFFLMGKKEGLFWTSVICLVTVFIFFDPYFLFTHFTYSQKFITRHLFVYFTVFLISYSYESVREKYKSAMENEQEKLIYEKKKLSEAKDEIEKANLLLKSEVETRSRAEQELRIQYDHLEEIITQRTLETKKKAEQLEVSEKRYRLMADNVHDVIWSSDIDLNFSFISPSVTRIYGYTVEEAMKLTPDKWNTPESQRKMIELYHQELNMEKEEFLDPDRFNMFQLDHIRKDGTIVPVELLTSFVRDENGKATGIIGVTRDVSERRAMEIEKEKIKEQLTQSQKMEALGTLVGGLAHEFNNFLGGIIGSFELVSNALIKEKLIKKDYIEKYLKIGMESSKRSAGLISQLLMLSKKHEIRLAPLDIKNPINHIYELCVNSFPKSIILDFSTEDTPLVIMGDMVQIEQLLLNLCINASHAMTVMRPYGEKHGGTLSIRVNRTGSEFSGGPRDKSETYTGNTAVEWVKVQVADTGVGIDDEAKHKIFEPFYSTKDKNECTGLGLAISYYIIQKHGGMVDVHSEKGIGTSFSIYFPAYIETDEAPDDDGGNKIVRGSGTVLVIDDEPAILKVAEGFLHQCGYDVITAGSADQGVRIFKNSYKEISAVLLDMSMPGKSGLEVLREVREINADVNVIFSSGMLDQDSRDFILGLGVREVINKPYSAAELSVKLNKIING